MSYHPSTTADSSAFPYSNEDRNADLQRLDAQGHLKPGTLRRPRRVRGFQRSDGCVVPTDPPSTGDDGGFKRPKGRKPVGLDWDDTQGLWVPTERSTSVIGKPKPEGKVQSPTLDVSSTGPKKPSPNSSGKKRKSPSSGNSNIPHKLLAPHPQSRWEEPNRMDGLTLYDRHRTPRPVLTGRIERPAGALLESFRCVICLDTIRKAVVAECLHRFCEECIEQALRVGKSSGQCPICRVVIPSKRSLVRDPDFDRLVENVVGDIATTEEPVVPLPSLPAVTLQKAICRKQSEQTTDPNEVQRMIPSRPTPDKYRGLLAGPAIIDIALHCHETEDDNVIDALTLPYLRLRETATIEVLKVFLHRKLNLAPHLTLQIFSFVPPNKPVILTDWLVLSSVAETFSSSSGMLELFYRLEPKKRKRKQRRVKRPLPASF